MGFQEEKFIEALLKCPAISNRKRRDAVVRKLPTPIKTRIERDETDRYDVISIVETCQNYSGGIEELIRSIRYFEGDSDSMQRIYKAIPSLLMCPEVIPHNLLTAIFRMALDIELPEADLQHLYSSSLPYDFEADNSIKTLWAAMAHLLNIPVDTSDKQFPILPFLERLTRHSQAQGSTPQIKNLVEQIAQELGLQPDEINATGERTLPYLFIIVRPVEQNKNEAANEKLYFLEAILWKHKQFEKAIFSSGMSIANAKPLHILPELVNEVFAKLTKDFPEEVPDLVIEFFLPQDLMSREVDQWEKYDEFLEKPLKLGCEHHVVVRSLERLENRTVREYLRKKWGYFRTQVKNQICAQHLICLYTWKVYQRFEVYYQLKIQETTCLGFTFKPEGSILLEFLRAGIPVALWPRISGENTGNADEMHTQIHVLISPDNVCKLPALIYEQRCQAGHDSIHIGNNLTLLWDNPERLPGKYHSQ